MILGKNLYERKSTELLYVNLRKNIFGFQLIVIGHMCLYIDQLPVINVHSS